MHLTTLGGMRQRTPSKLAHETEYYSSKFHLLPDQQFLYHIFAISPERTDVVANRLDLTIS